MLTNDWILNVLGYGACVLIALKIIVIMYRIIYPYFLTGGIHDMRTYSGGKWAGMHN
jgi:hypothetical protein